MRNLVICSLVLAAIAVAPVLEATAADQGAVMATDYTSTAYVGGLALDAPWPASPVPGEPVYHDAVMRWHDGRVWVVNRGGADNIQVLDPDQAYATVDQFSLGLGRNLQDIAFAADGTAYVSCYDEPELLHVDPLTGEILAVISTAAFADQDGLPETAWLHIRGDRLFVACQRLDRDSWYAPVGDSYLLVLDIGTNQWIDADPSLPGVQGVRLVGTDPYTRIVEAGDTLLVGCVGYYGMQDGGIERIDPEALVALGQEITESALGGDIVDLAVTGSTRHVIVADSSWVTHLVRYTPQGGLHTIASGTGYDFVDLAFDGDVQLFVADRRVGAAGVRVFDATSGVELTASPVDVGLPPSLIMLSGGDEAVGVTMPPAAPLAMAAPWPNPANPATRIEFVARPGEPVDLHLVDLRGRLVQRARIHADAQGRGHWTFDGTDRTGRSVASGAYRCVLQADGAFVARSLTIVR
jgi:hypothetical protein